MRLPIFDKKTDEHRLNEFEIRQLMLTATNLRKQGYDYAHIASTLSCSTTYARNLIKTAMREIIADSISEIIAQETERLNAIFLPAFIEATRVDAKGEPIFNQEATNTVIRIMERRAKLFGLDRPTKTELSGDLTLGAVKPVHIYLPDNGRGLPKGLTIQNEQIVEEASLLNLTTNDELLFVEEPATDLTDLEFDLYRDSPHIEVVNKMAAL